MEPHSSRKRSRWKLGVPRATASFTLPVPAPARKRNLTSPPSAIRLPRPDCREPHLPATIHGHETPRSRTTRPAGRRRRALRQSLDRHVNPRRPGGGRRRLRLAPRRPSRLCRGQARLRAPAAFTSRIGTPAGLPAPGPTCWPSWRATASPRGWSSIRPGVPRLAGTMLSTPMDSTPPWPRRGGRWTPCPKPPGLCGWSCPAFFLPGPCPRNLSIPTSPLQCPTRRMRKARKTTKRSRRKSRSRSQRKKRKSRRSIPSSTLPSARSKRTTT